MCNFFRVAILSCESSFTLLAAPLFFPSRENCFAGALMRLPLDLSHYFDCRRAAFNLNCTRNYPFSPRSPPNAGHTCARTHFLLLYSENNVAVARFTLFVAAAPNPPHAARSSGIECHGEESFRTAFAWRTSQSTKNSSSCLHWRTSIRQRKRFGSFSFAS